MSMIPAQHRNVPTATRGVVQVRRTIVEQGGGGSSDAVLFQATKNGNQSLTGTAFQDVTGWDTPSIADSDFSFNATTGVLTIQTTGRYQVGFNLTLDQNGGNNRTSGKARLVLGGSLVKGSECWGYHRQSTHGYDNYSASLFLSLTANDELKVQASNLSGSLVQQVLADSASFWAERKD